MLTAYSSYLLIVISIGDFVNILLSFLIVEPVLYGLFYEYSKIKFFKTEEPFPLGTYKKSVDYIFRRPLW